MEDILTVSQQPYDPKRPVVCLDEMPKQLLWDRWEPLLMQPFNPKKVDYAYRRGGVTNPFIFFEPLAGQCRFEITDQQRRMEWAKVIRLISDELYQEADKFVMVLDDLKTHVPAAFYLAFEPQEARRLVQRFEFHYTPKRL